MSLRVGGLLVVAGLAIALVLGGVFVVLGTLVAVCGGLVAAISMETAVAEENVDVQRSRDRSIPTTTRLPRK
jgi:hypothetical protein